MGKALSFDQSPPFSAPLRFFLSAPLFAVLAAAALLWQGPEALQSRWTPALLATTHLMTLGFMAMAMIGALMQVLPVVAGAPLPRPAPAAAAIHGLLIPGVLLLAGGLLIGSPPALRVALPLLAIAFALFLGVAGAGLARSPARSATALAIKLALAALATTVALGLILGSALGFSLHLPIPAVRLTNLHLEWGLLGWIGLLVMGVAFQVVPMFQMTPAYPAGFTRWLPQLLFLSLGLRVVGETLPPALEKQVASTAELAAAAAFTAFALVTLRLQSQRRRRQADATLLYWRTAMVSALGAVGLWAAGLLFPALATATGHGLLLGILMIAGFSYSVIAGMLYKIVPFLAWLHLQTRSLGRGTIPNVKEILPESLARRQFWSYAAALLLLVGATLSPRAFTFLGAALFGASSLWLWLNLLHVWRVYRTVNAALDAARGEDGNG